MSRSKTVLGLLCLLCGFLCLILGGCSFLKGSNGKLRDLEFTVLSEERLPPKLSELLQEKRKEAFEFTYMDQENLYICVGYGKQLSGGYSIAVDALYLTEENIHAATTLIGPDPSNKKKPTVTYPMIVIRTERLEQPVLFE